MTGQRYPINTKEQALKLKTDKRDKIELASHNNDDVLGCWTALSYENIPAKATRVYPIGP